MKHHIQKQQFILTIRQGLDAFAIQHAASRFLNEGLLPVLARIFDELSGDEEVIRLDSCVIDLGVIPESVLNSGVVNDEMYRKLKEEFRTALEKQLAHRPSARKPIGESVMERWWYYMEHGRLSWNADGFREEDYRRVLELFSVDYKQITRLRNALVEGSAMLTRIAAQHDPFFLENLVTVLVSSGQGGLAEAVSHAVEAHRILETIYRQRTGDISPGHIRAPEMPVEKMDRESLTRWAARMTTLRQAPMHERKAILWRQLLVLAAKHRDVFVRTGGVQLLLQDIPDAFMEMLIRELGGGDKGSFFQTMRRIAERQQRDKNTTEDIRHKEHREGITGYRPDEGGGTPRSPGLGEETGSPKQTPGDETEKPGKKRVAASSEEEMTDRLSGEKISPENPAEMKAVDKETAVTENKSDAGTTVPGAKEGKPEERIPPEQVLSSGSSTPPLATASPQDDQDRVSSVARLSPEDVQFRREEVGEEGIYLSNAGLILVHPFLSTIFNRLKWWNGGGFVSLEARQKAIFLLHFLATGERNAPEYDLVFPKMLCGYALELPVPGDVSLTDEECDEALVLLDNVILRWERLGKTSRDGLREAFLQRRGKLFDNGGRLSLVMESSAIDILLDYLPWNLSLVKLPWLKDILYVEWR